MDRFLEHSRIYYFENACQPEVFVGSADWMPRNFFRRIEVVFPIEDGNLRERIISEILAVTLADNTRARFLQPDGTYQCRQTRARAEKLSAASLNSSPLPGPATRRKPSPPPARPAFPRSACAPCQPQDRLIVNRLRKDELNNDF